MFFRSLNGNANVIEPLLKDPTNLYSLFIILFSTFFNVFFAVTLGGQVASKEFSNNTIGCLIQNSGRYKGFMAKIALIVIVCFSFIMFLILLGILLGLTVSGKVDNFSFINLLKRFAIGFFSTFLMSLFSMTVSIILKSTSKSNIFCIILFLGQSFMPFTISKYLLYFNPYYYLSVFSGSVFCNLKELTWISFRTTNTMSAYENVGLLFLYAIICFTIQILIYRKREYVS